MPLSGQKKYNRVEEYGVRSTEHGARAKQDYARIPSTAHGPRSSVTRDRGFTLVEILMVTMLVSIISLAVYSTFNSGMKVWQKINTAFPEEELYIFLDKFALDVRNCYKYSTIRFMGSEDSIEFPAFVDNAELKEKTVGKIIYSFDHSAGIWRREQRDYSQIYNDSNGLKQQLANVKSLRFQYYSYDKVQKAYLWQEGWQEGGLPLAVRVEIEFGSTQSIYKTIETVNIPVGG